MVDGAKTGCGSNNYMTSVSKSGMVGVSKELHMYDIFQVVLVMNVRFFIARCYFHVKRCNVTCGI